MTLRGTPFEPDRAPARSPGGKRRPSARPEEILQRHAIGLLKAALPADAFCLHCPNGGGRSPIEAAIFKAMGVVAGVPDLLVVWRGRAYWIELKAPRPLLADGTPSAAKRYQRTGDQCETTAALLAAGCETACAWSLEEVEALLRFWNLPLRSHPLPRATALVERWRWEHGPAQPVSGAA